VPVLLIEDNRLLRDGLKMVDLHDDSSVFSFRPSAASNGPPFRGLLSPGPGIFGPATTDRTMDVDKEALAAIQPLDVYTVVGPQGVRLVVPQTFSNGASARDYGGEIPIGRHPGAWREVHYRNVDRPRWMAGFELGHGPHVQVDVFRIGLHQIVCFLRV
jgi:hypothetical protein